MKNQGKNKIKYEYNRDEFGKIRKAKVTYDPSVIRIKSLEGVYRWWKGLTIDTRFSLIPIGFCFVAVFTIYNLSMYFYDKEERIKLKAMIPEYMSDKEKFEEFKRKKSQTN